MRLTYLFLAAGLSIFAVSCRQQRYLYSPTKVNTPALQKRGDSRFNTSFSFGNARGLGDSSKNYGVDIQAVIAITDHLAVIGSFYSRSEADKMGDLYRRAMNFTNSFITYRRRYWEAGIGYFNAMKPKSFFHVYGGGAIGELTINDVGLIDSVAYSRFHDTRLNKVFIQPGFNFFTRNGGSFNLDMKLNLLLLNANRSSYTAAELEYFSINKTGTSLQLFIAEPSFNMQLPLPPTDWLKIESSITGIFNPTSYRTRGWNISIGVTIDPVKAFKPMGSK